MERRERITIPVDAKKVSAILSVPPEGLASANALVVLAHGAGNDMEHPLLVSMTEGLAAGGFATVRFNFPYREAGRKTPDPTPRLESTWLEVTDSLRAKLEGLKLPLVVGGKSLGGRVAAGLVAAEVIDAAAMIFLGYPLHRAGDEGNLRDEPLTQIEAPMLFLQGGKDRMCRVELLQKSLKSAQRKANVHVVAEGDHSLDVPVRAEREGVRNELVQVSLDWLRKSIRRSARR